MYAPVLKEGSKDGVPPGWRGVRWRRAGHCVVSASSVGGGPSFRGVGYRRGVRLASDFVFVVCALSLGNAHRSVRLGVGGEFA